MNYAPPISYLLPAEPKERTHDRALIEMELFETDLIKRLGDVLWKNREGELTLSEMGAELAEIYELAEERLDDAVAREEKDSE